MDEPQGMSGLSRRTVVKAAAWSLPVMAVGSQAPAMAASPCEFEVRPGSFKCCNGPVKNFKLVLRPTGACIGSQICLVEVITTQGGGKSWPVNECVSPGGEFTVYLDDAPSCSVNLIAVYNIDGGSNVSVAIKSDNIEQGNTDGACLPPLPPTISAFNPSPIASGLTNAGFEITGTNFQVGSTTVLFNGIAPITFTVNSPGQITGDVNTTSFTSGTPVELKVTTPGGTATLSIPVSPP